MKKLVSVLLVLTMALSLIGGAVAEGKDYSGYTIRIYSNSNSTERVNWLVNAAKEAGFTISIDDNSVISGDTAAIQKANENKDGDIIFGLNEVRWSQLVNGTYENLKVLDWTPTWADKVGQYVYPGKAYGLSFIQSGFDVAGFICDASVVVTKSVTADAMTTRTANTAISIKFFLFSAVFCFILSNPTIKPDPQ